MVVAVRYGHCYGSLLVFVVIAKIMAFGRCGSIRQRWVEVVVVHHHWHQDGNLGLLCCGVIVEVVVGGVG